MKNKNFTSLNKAFTYFDMVKLNFVAFLIHNREEYRYEVINQDLYDHYVDEFNLDMELIELSC